jgi:hypothetical protein
VFELLFRYGIRDFRSIGHKAIFVANSWRTLQNIGRQHAEPVLRSLAYALLNHQGEPNPSTGDLMPDRAWRRNQELVDSIRADRQDGKTDSDATSEMLAVLRQGSSEEACQQAVAFLNRGVAVQSIWDALFDGSGELLVRQAGIVALHAMTTTNAMHLIYGASGDDRTRRLALLQNVAFLPLFREAMANRGQVREHQIDRLEPISSQKGSLSIEDIFADVSQDRMTAARKVMGYLQSSGDPKSLIDAARRLVFLKGNDPHDYKFSSAVLEDYYHVSPNWRNRYLAASVFSLCGSGDRDNELVQRTRAALSA